jgi:hypothetical protein
MARWYEWPDEAPGLDKQSWTLKLRPAPPKTIRPPLHSRHMEPSCTVHNRLQSPARPEGVRIPGESTRTTKISEQQLGQRSAGAEGEEHEQSRAASTKLNVDPEPMQGDCRGDTRHPLLCVFVSAEPSITPSVPAN